MVCPICGSNVRKKDVFCPKCGARVNGTIDQNTNHTQDANDTSEDDFVSNEDLKRSITEIQNNMEKSAKRRRTTTILEIM